MFFTHTKITVIIQSNNSAGGCYMYGCSLLWWACSKLGKDDWYLVYFWMYPSTLWDNILLFHDTRSMNYQCRVFLLQLFQLTHTHKSCASVAEWLRWHTNDQLLGLWGQIPGQFSDCKFTHIYATTWWTKLILLVGLFAKCVCAFSPGRWDWYIGMCPKAIVAMCIIGLLICMIANKGLHKPNLTFKKKKMLLQYSPKPSSTVYTYHNLGQW